MKIRQTSNSILKASVSVGKKQVYATWIIYAFEDASYQSLPFEDASDIRSDSLPFGLQK